MKKLNGKNKEVLVISDTHIPYSHVDYVKFLRAIKNKYKPSIILHIGDELDYHAISFHDFDSSLFSADTELDTAIDEIHSGLHQLFPKMYLLESNHGSLIYRKIKHMGVPIRTIKPLHELYETPLWSWHHEIVLDTKIGPVYLCHGKSGAYGKCARENMMSAIQGHFHGKFEITWHKSPMGMRFNAFTGCLVNGDSMAMAYAKNNLPKPILGCLRIDKEGIPHLLQMRLDKKGRFNGKI